MFLPKWCLTFALLLTLTATARAQDAFIDAVASFAPGTNAGFGAASLPGIIQGPPVGGGELQGSLDVVSLGNDGVIVVRFDLPVICDGPGPDFTVFENAFHAGAIENPVFTEFGIVAVSQDGVTFLDIPYDPVTHAGLAGQTPVLSNPENGIDPLDPSVSGGDAFDLAATGLPWAAYVRITDPGTAIPDPGNAFGGTSAGFDLDAIAAVNACDPAVAPSATPTPTPTHTPAQPSATPTLAGPIPMHDASIVAHRPVRVRIARGQTTAVKRMRIKVRNGDATASVPIRLTAVGCGAAIAGTPDFDRDAAGPQDVAVIRAGRGKTATVSLTISADMVATPNRSQPATCLLTASAVADVAGNVDPTPSDNTAAIELRVLDVNDLQ